jgi:hypothetical protein
VTPPRASTKRTATAASARTRSNQALEPRGILEEPQQGLAAGQALEPRQGIGADQESLPQALILDVYVWVLWGARQPEQKPLGLPTRTPQE